MAETICHKHGETTRELSEGDSGLSRAPTASWGKGQIEEVEVCPFEGSLEAAKTKNLAQQLNQCRETGNSSSHAARDLLIIIFLFILHPFYILNLHNTASSLSSFINTAIVHISCISCFGSDNFTLDFHEVLVKGKKKKEKKQAI